MVSKFSPGSFTKNFSWKKDPKRLHRSVRDGFSRRLEPVTRVNWRKNSGLNDPDIELIPMNFFLHSRSGLRDDFIVVDRLVELAVQRPYDKQFALLALFAFHLAHSGSWHNSQWADGRVASWANLFIRDVAWKNGGWVNSAFEKQFLMEFVAQHLEGKDVTKTKVRNNYRFMFENAGLLMEGKLQPIDFSARWPMDATQLFWDRQILGGVIPGTNNVKMLEEQFFEHEIYKLLGCNVDQGRVFVLAAFREYVHDRLERRVRQRDELQAKLSVAA